MCLRWTILTCSLKDILFNKAMNYVLSLFSNMCSGRTQELEEEQPTVEQELRRLMEKPGEDF